MAVNSGTITDPDGNIVSLTASAGSVINNNDGSYTWSLATNDGPFDSQAITIYADDGNGGTAQTSFDLAVNNSAPSVGVITLPAAPIDINEQPVSGITAVFSDPGGSYDAPYICTIDFGDGSGPQAGTISGVICSGPEHTYADPGVYAVTVAVTDKDIESGSAMASAYVVITIPGVDLSPAAAG